MIRLKPINYNDNVKYYIPVTEENEAILSNYYSAVNTLMKNDRNGSYDTLLKDLDYCLNKSYRTLKDILYRLTHEEGLEGEELQFYKEVDNILI